MGFYDKNGKLNKNNDGSVFVLKDSIILVYLIEIEIFLEKCIKVIFLE